MKKVLLVLSMGILLCSCELQSSNPNGQQLSQTRQTALRETRSRSRSETVSGVSSRVKMIKDGGVYKVPIKINGCSMDFIFDTGASAISISSVEAYFLYKQGKLTEDDFEGEVIINTADGNVGEGVIVNLKEVQIANKKLYNVKAFVIDNEDAPVLLGQSALARFGKISIDYNNLTIEFQ